MKNKKQKKCECDCYWCTRLPPLHKTCNWNCKLTSTPTKSTNECGVLIYPEVGARCINPRPCFIHNNPSPTKPDQRPMSTTDIVFNPKPDTEEWEVSLGQLCSLSWKNGLWHSEATFSKDIRDFIRQEKEKSYQEGLNDANVLVKSG